MINKKELRRDIEQLVLPERKIIKNIYKELDELSKGGGETDGGNFNPDGDNTIGENFKLNTPYSHYSFYNNEFEYNFYNDGILSSRFNYMNGYEDENNYHGSSLVFGRWEYDEFMLDTTIGIAINFNGNVDKKYAKIYFPSDVEDIGSYLILPKTGTYDSMFTSNVVKKVIPVSVNNISANSEGNIQLTASTLISILQTATEAEKTQIKNLLGIYDNA